MDALKRVREFLLAKYDNGRPNLENGRPVDYSAALKSAHRNHVHLGGPADGHP